MYPEDLNELAMTRKSPTENTRSLSFIQGSSTHFLLLLFNVLREAKYARLYVTSPMDLDFGNETSEVLKLTISQNIESAVMIKLINWAMVPFESSLGQPAPPHIKIALNATDVIIDASQWDVADATAQLLSNVEFFPHKILALRDRDHVESWIHIA